MKIIPKNHSERFSFLEKYFKDIYNRVSDLFSMYTKSYSLKLGKEEAIKLKNYANELKNLVYKK
jgi:predicted butyrate kinase (DUF1464 family)